MQQRRRKTHIKTRQGAALLGFGALALSAGTAMAQDANFGGLDNDPNAIRGFHLTYGAGLTETLTDNVRGTASGGNLLANGAGAISTGGNGREADLVTTIAPNVTLADVTRRAQFAFTYTPSYSKFAAASDLDRFDNAFTGTGNFDLWHEHLVLDTTASVSRQIINNQGAVTTSGLNSSVNQTNVSTFTLSPTYSTRFGDFATGQLKYLLGFTDSGVTAPTVQNQVSAGVTSGNDFSQLQWSVTFSDTETDQGDQSNSGELVNSAVNPTTTGNLSDRVAQAQVNYALTRSLTLLSGFGYEKITDDTVSANNQNGPIGSFGIGVDGAFLHFKLNYNFRYGSQFASFDGSADISENLKVLASYGESIQTQQSLAIQNASNIGFAGTQNGQPGFFTPVGNNQLAFNPTPASGGINNGLGNASFLNKNGQIAVTGNYDRDSWSLTLQQNSQSSSQVNFNETTLNVTAGYQRQLTPSTRFNLNLGYFNVSQTSPSASSDNTYDAAAGLSYELGQGVTTSGTYSFLYRRSSQSGQDIRANSLILTLNKAF